MRGGLLKAGLSVLLLAAAGSGLWMFKESVRQNADSRGTLQELQEARGQADRQVQELKRINEQLAADLERARTEAAGAREAAEAAQQQWDPPPAGKRGREGRMAEKIALLEKEQRLSAQQVKEMKKVLKQRERQIAQISEELAAAQKQATRSRTEQEDLTQRIKQSELQNQQFRKAAEEARSAVERVQRALAQAEQQRGRLAQQVDAAQADRKEAQRMRRELAEANDRIAELVVALDQQERLTAQLTAEGASDAAAD